MHKGDISFKSMIVVFLLLIVTFAAGYDIGHYNAKKNWRNYSSPGPAIYIKLEEGIELRDDIIRRITKMNDEYKDIIKRHIIDREDPNQ